MTCSFGDENGSDVELNPVVGGDMILKTEEVSVEVAPGACGVYDFAAEKRWAKDVQRSPRDNS